MSKEFDRLKKELRADLELMWGSQSASNTRIEAISQRIESQAEMIAEQGHQIAEQGRKIVEHGLKIERQALAIEASMKHTAALGREVVALGDQMVGRLRQFDYKFGKLLGALEKDSDNRYRALEKRVARLEQKGDPAA